MKGDRQHVINLTAAFPTYQKESKDVIEYMNNYDSDFSNDENRLPILSYRKTYSLILTLVIAIHLLDVEVDENSRISDILINGPGISLNKKTEAGHKYGGMSKCKIKISAVMSVPIGIATGVAVNITTKNPAYAAIVA